MKTLHIARHTRIAAARGITALARAARNAIAHAVRVAGLAWELFATEEPPENLKRRWRYFHYLRLTRVQGLDDTEAVAAASALRGFLIWLRHGEPSRRFTDMPR